MNCTHPETYRGKDIPRRWGSYQSEVCQLCGAFRKKTHLGKVESVWLPADEYESATEDLELD